MKNSPKIKLGSNTSLPTSRGVGHPVEMSRTTLSSLIDLAARTGRGIPDSIELAHFGDFGIIRDGDQDLIRIRSEGGNIRSLTAQPGISLYRAPFDGQSLAYVNRYLEEDTVRKSLKLANVNLVAEEVSDMGISGERVGYRQMVRTKCTEDGCLKDIEIPVYKGFIYASVSSEGELINLTSTITHARKPDRLGKVISKQEAVDFAQKRFGKRTEVASNELFMVENSGDFEPVYVITLRKLSPTKVSGPSVKEVLVDAKSGRIVHWYERLRFNQHSSAQDRVLNSPVGSVLHRIPDPSDDIAKQASTEFFENLPDPSTMANQFFNVFTLQGAGSGSKGMDTARSFTQATKKKKGQSKKAAKQWKLLKANADGNFVFKVGTDGFCAAIDFFALTKEMEICARLGLKKVTIVVPVHINDPENQDNAWLDPTSPLMSIGQGTGVNRGGLIKYIAYDIGVCWHECGHWIVTIQTPGHDLTGSEGAAMHEAIGDIMSVIMNCLFRLMYAKKIGMNFTKKDLQADAFDIGGYAAQPGVIRHGRNHKQDPQDRTGEPHDDSEIVTGALVDFFTDFVLAWPGDNLVEAIEAFLQVILYALANMPASQQKFTDLLQALITAVQNCTKGKSDTKTVEAAFKKHSIVLGATPPVVVKRRRRRSKTPMTVAA